MATDYRLRTAAALAAILFSWTGDASALAPEEIEKIDVYPPQVRLEGAKDRQRFVVVATSADGVTQDVTEQASARLSDPKLVRMEQNMLHPVADGSVQLEVEHAGKKAAVPVSVVEVAKTRPVSFEMDVMVVILVSAQSMNGRPTFGPMNSGFCCQPCVPRQRRPR